MENILTVTCLATNIPLDIELDLEYTPIQEI